MTFRRPLSILFAAAALAAACGPKPAPAPTVTDPAPDAPPATPAAPTAESIIEAHIEATGGRAAREAVTSMRALATMRIAKLGIGGKMEMMLKVPNLARVVVDIDGLGRTENGSDGTTVWQKNAMTGARVLEGEERERTLRDGMLHAELKWRELYSKAELLGEAEFEGAAVWKLQMTTTLGDVETLYYDRETRLLVGKEAISKTQMGEIPTRSRYVEYQTYGGLKMPNKLVESTQGMDIEITMDQVELNPTLPADTFAVPADVIPLIKK